MQISYSELSKKVGDMILNNEVRSLTVGDLDDSFTLENGSDSFCYKHETEEECKKEDHECEYEYKDIYQDYIISKEGAEYLKQNTDEIVWYSKRLEMYVWSITHFGTSWNGVYTELINK